MNGSNQQIHSVANLPNFTGIKVETAWPDFTEVLGDKSIVDGWRNMEDGKISERFINDFRTLMKNAVSGELDKLGSKLQLAMPAPYEEANAAFRGLYHQTLQNFSITRGTPETQGRGPGFLSNKKVKENVYGEIEEVPKATAKFGQMITELNGDGAFRETTNDDVWGITIRGRCAPSEKRTKDGSEGGKRGTKRYF